ncbi:MAG: polysaccharide biosynthesis/export family protein [Nitratireductor sp.]
MFKRTKTTFSALAIVSVLATGCATYQPVNEAFHAVLSQPYHLDAGDRLRITVFEQANLSNTYSVDKGGYLSFPLIGSVQARGKTLKEVERNIAMQLRDGFIRNPDVSVEVDRYRPFYIMGEVNAAGQYTYVPGMTAQNAVAIAGGFTGRAQQQDVDVTRHANGKIVNGRVPFSDPIMPGDTLYLRERLY